MNRTMNHIKKQIFLFIMLLLVSCSACRSDENKIKMYKNPEDMKQEILKHIPIGSSIKDAQRVMEANGFKCEMSYGSFVEMYEGERFPRAKHDNTPHLYCDKEVNSEIFSLRRWQIAIVHKDGVVSDVFM